MQGASASTMSDRAGRSIFDRSTAASTVVGRSVARLVRLSGGSRLVISRLLTGGSILDRSILDRSIVRRWIAVACALMLMVVGVLHHLMPDHYAFGADMAAPAATAALPSDAAPPSDDGPGGVAVAADYCSACTAVSLPAIALRGTSARRTLAVDSLVPPAMRAHPPGIELPPPRRPV